MENFTKPFIPGDEQQRNEYEEMMADVLGTPEESFDAQHENRINSLKGFAKNSAIELGAGFGTMVVLNSLGHDGNIIPALVAFGTGVLNATRMTIKSRRMERDLEE